jgi:hypothetical protein
MTILAHHISSVTSNEVVCRRSSGEIELLEEFFGKHAPVS